MSKFKDPHWSTNKIDGPIVETIIVPETHGNGIYNYIHVCN